MADETGAKKLGYILDVLEEGVALPALIKADTESLRLQNTLQKSLPAIAQVGSDPLVGYSTKAQDALQLAIEKGLAYGDTKADLKKQKIISKLEERAQEQYFRDRNKAFEKRLGFLSRGTKRGQDAFTRRFAGEMLGLGPDLYRVLG